MSSAGRMTRPTATRRRRAGDEARGGVVLLPCGCPARRIYVTRGCTLRHPPGLRSSSKLQCHITAHNLDKIRTAQALASEGPALIASAEHAPV